MCLLLGKATGWVFLQISANTASTLITLIDKLFTVYKVILQYAVYLSLSLSLQCHQVCPSFKGSAYVVLLWWFMHFLLCSADSWNGAGLHNRVLTLGATESFNRVGLLILYCMCILYVSGLLRPRSSRIPHHIICTSSATDSWRRDRRASWARKRSDHKRISLINLVCKINLVNSGKCITIVPHMILI